MHDAQTRGLPGLVFWGLGEPERSGEAPIACFEAGRQTQTQSSVTAGKFSADGPRPQMDVWFCAPQEPLPRGTIALLLQDAPFSKAAFPKSRWAPPSALLTLLIMDVISGEPGMFRSQPDHCTTCGGHPEEAFRPETARGGVAPPQQLLPGRWSDRGLPDHRSAISRCRMHRVIAVVNPDSRWIPQ